MNRGYEDEANMRREKERRRKMEEAEMDRKRRENYLRITDRGNQTGSCAASKAL